MNRRLLLLSVLAIVVAFVAAPASAQTCSSSFDLVAGQHIDAGWVDVTQSGNQLIVTYNSTGGWLITETHLHVATSLGDVPATKNGNPVPGRFDYSSTYNPGVTSAVYVVNISGVAPGTNLVIAAHAVVESGSGKGETAWSTGNKFPGKNWFTYSTFRTCREVVE